MAFDCEYFKVTWEEFDKFIEAYPAVNILVEMRKMVCWLDANPKRRKKNIKRFINNWLAKSHRDLEKEKRNGQRESFNERRSRTSAEAIFEVFGSDDAVVGKIHGTLPPADK